MNNSIKLYDGFVQVIDHLGSDTDIVNAARVSYNGKTKGFENDMKLLAYLMRNDHHVPFESGVLVFLVEIPNVIARHLLRYRTISANEVSGRYVVLGRDKFYKPKKLRKQNKLNKQGSSNECLSDAEYLEYSNRIDELVEKSTRLYCDMLESGVAREISRMYLPHLAMYTKIRFRIDIRNLMNLLDQRLDKHAQEETRMFAKALEKHFKTFFPETHKLWKKKFKLEKARKARQETMARKLSDSKA